MFKTSIIIDSEITKKKKKEPFQLIRGLSWHLLKNLWNKYYTKYECENSLLMTTGIYQSYFLEKSKDSSKFSYISVSF